MNRVWRNRAILFLLWAVFYGSVTLFHPPLLDDADSVHAEVAREMLLRHDWVTLHANGIRYLEKAPLYYWAMAASMRLFGPTTAASRLPLALGMLALALLMEAFARRSRTTELTEERVQTGLYAGLITLSSFGFFIFSRINIPDVLVCLWLVLAMSCLVRTEADERPARAACWGFAAACALLVLTKGLIGIVFPVGLAGLYLVATRGWRSALRRMRTMHLLSATGVFLLLAVPWHVLAGLRNPGAGSPGGLSFTGGHWSVPLPTEGNVHGWTWFYFVNEQVLRYLNLRVPRDYDTVPLALFWGLCFAWMLPWSAWLPGAFARAVPARDADWQARLRANRLTAGERTDLLLVLWTLIPLLFFSFSTRQEYYVLPSLPAMTLLLARYLAAPATAGVRRAGAVLAGVGMASGLVCAYLLLHTQRPGPDVELASLLQQNPADYALSFGHFLDLNARALGLFRGSLWLTMLVVGIGWPLQWWLRRSAPSARAANAVIATSAFLFLIPSWWALAIFNPVLSSEPLARAIAPQIRPQDLLVLHGEYEAGSTLGFYLRRDDLHILEGRSANLWYGSFFPDAPRIFETRQSMAAQWPGPRRIFLWEDPNDAERPPFQPPGPIYVVAQGGGKRILSNQPNR